MLAVSVVVFGAKSIVTKAADFNITKPANNSLVGAGNIEITWEAVANASSYDVYVAGTKKGSTTSTSFSFYNVNVEAVEACVVANLKDGSQKGSTKVQFGISKKGLGLDNKSMMGTYVNLKDWKCGWYYNWGESPSKGSNYDGVEFIPMVWKSTTANDLKTRVLKAKNAGYKYILTFNEPDLSGQCNMKVNDVYNAWKGIAGMTGIKISSPVTAQWPNASAGWFQPFMNKLTSSDYDPDFISIHCYPDNYAGAGMADWFMENVVDWTWNKYHKPIWITEFSTTGEYVTASATTQFWKAVMPKLDACPYVERYAAFGFNARDKKNVGLWYYSTGAWTDAGEVYRNQSNPDFNSVKLSGVDYSKLKKAGGASSVEKPAKVKLKSAKYKKKRKILVKFKKAARAKGYQVRWCDSKSFSGYEQKNIKKTKYTIKGLDKNTKYYVKVRAYNVSNNVRQYGKWSSVKKVKVKK